ncbi:mannosyl-oligosaccharide 1,2-alpha-mannosidase [Hyaloraphidium curvatum]|nr:mannosyl-oligosaccharide 1,2-alpha-mannosidase [Hyaloraphidium curvatum]
MEHRYVAKSSYLDAIRGGGGGGDGTLPIYYSRPGAPGAYDNAKRIRRGYPWVAFRLWLRKNWGPPLIAALVLAFLGAVFIAVRLLAPSHPRRAAVVVNGDEPNYIPREQMPEHQGEGKVHGVGRYREAEHRKDVPPRKHGEDGKEAPPHKPERHAKPPAKHGEEEAADDQHPPAAAEEGPGEEVWKERAQAVKDAFIHSWDGYRKYAWGYDHLLPVSRKGEDWFGLGLTITDSLDTMWIMNLTEQFQAGRDWIASDLRFTHDGDSNVFEVTIRALAGMLSAYHFSKDPVFLSKAKELANILLPAFDTASKLPLASVNFARREAVAAHFNGGASSTAEVATLQLEFKYLSELTGDPRYWRAVEQVMLKLEALPKYDGLVPIFINPISGRFEGNEIRLGSRGDSYYEYLIKQYLQTNRTEAGYRRAWDGAVDGIKRHLVAHSRPGNLTFVGELPQGRSSHGVYPKMDHLVCFLGGALALGASGDGRRIADRAKLTPLQKSDLELGEELTRTCYETYRQMATGLAPEIVYFNTEPDKDQDIEVRPLDAHNLLRPETVESLFVLWRITGDAKYRHWGWEIFESFVKYSRVATGGFTCLNDVTTIPPPRRDKQESFWLAETLKYLYLLFSPDDLIPLNEYVLNTEAHPLPVFSITDELKEKLAGK